MNSVKTKRAGLPKKMALGIEPAQSPRCFASPENSPRSVVHLFNQSCRRLNRHGRQGEGLQVWLPRRLLISLAGPPIDTVRLRLAFFAWASLQ